MQKPKAEKRAENIAHILLSRGAVIFEDKLLHSERTAPVYVDCRVLNGYPREAKIIAGCMADLIKHLEFDRVAGVAYGGIPMATMVAWSNDWPLLVARKEAKEYGTKQLIIGPYEANDRVVLIEDVVTTGKSVLKTALTYRTAGLQVSGLATLVDACQDGLEALAEEKITAHTCTDLRTIIEMARSTGRLNDTVRYELCKKYAPARTY